MKTLPLEIVLQAETLHCQGIICPGVMWDYIVDALVAIEASTVLETVPTEVQIGLRLSYRERPLSLQNGHNNEVRRDIEIWCQRDQKSISQ